jgi:hypothetical protein
MKCKNCLFWCEEEQRSNEGYCTYDERGLFKINAEADCYLRGRELELVGQIHEKVESKPKQLVYLLCDNYETFEIKEDKTRIPVEFDYLSKFMSVSGNAGISVFSFSDYYLKLFKNRIADGEVDRTNTISTMLLEFGLITEQDFEVENVKEEC